MNTDHLAFIKVFWGIHRINPMAAIDECQEPHFALLPFMAQGHTIPMVDIARLLAKRGATVTILTTAHNGRRFEKVIDRAIDCGLDIRVVHLKLPCVEAGLPQGCENFDMLASMEDGAKFFVAVGMLEDQVREIIQELEPRVKCLIADMCFTWASNLGKVLHIPRLMFHGTSCFSLLCIHLVKAEDFETIASDFEHFVLPGLPDRIEFTKAQLWDTVSRTDPKWDEIRDQMRRAEDEAFGSVINTFHDLEPEYVKEYMKVRQGKKLWSIGPVSLCNKDGLDIAERGNKASIDKNKCLKWLDLQEKASVIYVCLGSLSHVSDSQMVELGLALRDSNRPFIWVIRKASDELKTRLSEEKLGDEEEDTNLIIHGWAPQVMILSHPSVGGFLTHCGWNSTLEGITAGLPMITWPAFGDQFCNEKLVVHVIKTGVRVGVELPVLLGEEEKVGVLVKYDELRRVIDELMDGGEEGEERRNRARKLGEMAQRATEEGGSSFKNIELLVQDVAMYQENEAILSSNGAEY
ncbi:UDP-glycosyltransferase 73C4-like [Henckelia pumila]|uniref:UDP-glycosyltransferase 73C4-like n=1 Tax=Henckelia pumila TaxID=405737 RepID=UPI003C6E487E